MVGESDVERPHVDEPVSDCTAELMEKFCLKERSAEIDWKGKTELQKICSDGFPGSIWFSLIRAYDSC